MFGGRTGSVAVSSSQSILGHMLGTTGAVQALITVIALKRQQVPRRRTWTTSIRRVPVCAMSRESASRCRCGRADQLVHVQRLECGACVPTPRDRPELVRCRFTMPVEPIEPIMQPLDSAAGPTGKYGRWLGRDRLWRSSGRRTASRPPHRPARRRGVSGRRHDAASSRARIRRVMASRRRPSDPRSARSEQRNRLVG